MFKTCKQVHGMREREREREREMWTSDLSTLRTCTTEKEKERERERDMWTSDLYYRHVDIRSDPVLQTCGHQICTTDMWTSDLSTLQPCTTEKERVSERDTCGQQISLHCT